MRDIQGLPGCTRIDEAHTLYVPGHYALRFRLLVGQPHRHTGSIPWPADLNYEQSVSTSADSDSPVSARALS